MKCPVCIEVDLLMSERSGIEIDYCPKCRGVWLDRGELDKIIANSQPISQTPQREAQSNIYDRRYDRDDYKSYPKDYGYHKPKKKESFLSELFDF